MKLLLFSLVIFTSVFSQKLPNYIVPCARNQPDFHQCCIDNGVKAIPYILKGDRAFRIPSLTPLKLPKVAIDTNSNFKITLTDLEIHGIDTVTLKDVVFDFDNNIIKVSLMMEYLTVLSQYEIDGRLVVPLQGSGPANITSIRPKIDYEVDFTIVQKNGKEYINVEKDRLKLKSETARYQLDNLFGNKQLSDETNKILNENAKDVSKELNGPISETIRTIVTELIKGYLTRVPLDKIFL